MRMMFGVRNEVLSQSFTGLALMREGFAKEVLGPHCTEDR
jgi:hypothetical protein